MTKYELLHERKCDCCGNNFIPTANYAYKERYGCKVKWFCKYTCMLKFRKAHPRKPTRRVKP